MEISLLLSILSLTLIILGFFIYIISIILFAKLFLFHYDKHNTKLSNIALFIAVIGTLLLVISFIIIDIFHLDLSTLIL